MSSQEQPRVERGAGDPDELDFGPFRPAPPTFLPLPDLAVHVELRSPAAAIVRVVGELDIATAPLLRTRIESVLAAAPPRVVVDLSHVRYIGSAGLAALLDAVQRGERLGIVVTVSTASRPVRRVLQLTGLAELLGCGRDPDMAG